MQLSEAKEKLVAGGYTIGGETTKHLFVELRDRHGSYMMAEAMNIMDGSVDGPHIIDLIAEKDAIIESIYASFL